jgi:hypothetical protein
MVQPQKNETLTPDRIRWYSSIRHAAVQDALAQPTTIYLVDCAPAGEAIDPQKLRWRSTYPAFCVPVVSPQAMKDMEPYFRHVTPFSILYMPVWDEQEAQMARFLCHPTEYEDKHHPVGRHVERRLPALPSPLVSNCLPTFQVPSVSPSLLAFIQHRSSSAASFWIFPFLRHPPARAAQCAHFDRTLLGLLLLFGDTRVTDHSKESNEMGAIECEHSKGAQAGKQRMGRTVLAATITLVCSIVQKSIR